MIEREFYVSSSAPEGGDGTKSKPFATFAEIPFRDDERNVVRVLAGSTFDVPHRVRVPAFTRIVKEGQGADPILDGGDRDLYGIIHIVDANQVEVSGLHLRRARHAMLIEGTARDCVIEGVTAEECYGLGGFAHEDTSSAKGRVVFIDCHAIKCEGDGFSNRGGADDLLLGCTAVHCGPIWGVYELAENIPSVTRGVNYLPVTPTRPNILRNVYVDSVNGNDANDGLSPATAWATGTKVSASSLAGDRIHIERGSTITAAITLKDDQEIVTSGTGRRPYFQNISGGGIIANGVSRVWIEGIDSKDCSPGVLVTGDVSDVWIADSLFNQADTFGVQCNDAAGSGDVNLFKCGFYWNDDGSVHGTAGDYVISAWECRGTDNGRLIDSTAAAAWRVSDGCSFQLHNVEEVSPYYRGLALENDTGSNLIFGCWFSDPKDNAGSTFRKAIEISGDGTHEIANTVATILDPGSGETTIGLHATGGTVKVYNCTFQDTRNTGGAGSSSVTVTSGVASYDQRNCLFDAANGNSGTVYVTTDATITGKLTFAHNFYHDWSGDLSLAGWYDTDAGATMNVSQWVAIDGNDEESNGGLPSDQLTKNLPATARGLDARIEDEPTAVHFAGQDLAAAGLVTWTTDAGHRERGRNPSGGWMPGAWVNLTGSPDGYTTHADSAMRMEDCAAIWCQNGIDFTHDHAPSAEECGLYRCEFIECYDGGIEQAITSPFPIHDCRFIGGSSSAIDINPGSGQTGTWEFIGCEFDRVAADAMLKLRSNETVTVNVVSCIFRGPEAHWWPLPSVAHSALVTLGNGNITANFVDCVFWQVVARNSTSLVYGVRSEASADGTVSFHNCQHYAPDEANSLYFRADALARVGESDNNFWHDKDTNGNAWRAGGSAIAFSAWGALNQGTSGGATDGNGWESTDKICARPNVGDERYFPPEVFRVFHNSPQGVGGANKAAISRMAFGGAVQPSAGAWSVGPFAGVASADTIFRTGRGVTFAGLALSANLYQDIPLGKDTKGGVRITDIELWSGGGDDLGVTIHVGPLALGNVVWSGFLPSSKAASFADNIETPDGEELRVSFSANSGTVYGSIRWDDQVDSRFSAAPKRER